jgi:hypothetical protein
LVVVRALPSASTAAFGDLERDLERCIAVVEGAPV